MKKRMTVLLTAAVLTAGMEMTAFGATPQEIISQNQTSYTAGTGSVYGPSLTQEQLNAVAQAAADFKTSYINDSMDHDAKIRTAHDYLKNHVSYIDWNRGEGANTAYGALVKGQAACSGYARAFKALCDAMDVSCYYIHADASAGNPSHQWNLVEYNDGYYFIDVQANDDSGFDWIYHSATHPYTCDMSGLPAIGSKSGQSTAGAETAAVTEGWQQDAAGWWWQNADGSYPVGQWKEINGKQYYFDADGYMLAGTTTPDGYKVGTDGAWIPDADEALQKEIPWIVPASADGMERAPGWLDLRWRWKDENGNYYKNCWVNYPGTNAWRYLDSDGYSLIDAVTPDGYHVDDSGWYNMPQYNAEGKRTLMEGDVINNDVEILEERVDTNGNNYCLISPDTTTISFKHMDTIDESALELCFAAYRYSPETNTIYPFSNDGTAVYEEFQFGKSYPIRLSETSLTGAALVDYCKQNNILINIGVYNRIDGLGVSFLYCYE